MQYHDWIKKEKKEERRGCRRWEGGVMKQEENDNHARHANMAPMTCSGDLLCI